MARTVNYSKRAEKIKEMIDDLVKEMGHSPHRMAKKDKIKLIDIDFENIDVVTLMRRYRHASAALFLKKVNNVNKTYL